MSKVLPRIIICLVLALTTLVGSGVKAGTYNPDNIPIPRNAEHPSYISNPDGILDREVCNRVNQMLLDLELKSNVRMLVMVVEHIEGDDPFQFSLEVGNRYGIGDKADNKGLILTLATLDRSYWLLTGDGLESELPDALCKRLENRVMVPELKKSDWNAAIEKTTDAICRLLGGDGELRSLLNNPIEESDAAATADDDFDYDSLSWWAKAGIWVLVVIGILVLVVVGSAPWIIVFLPFLPFYGIYKLWKWVGLHWCPECNRFSMKKGKWRIEKIKGETNKYKRYTKWHCAHCQHMYEQVEDYEPEPLKSKSDSGSSSSWRSSTRDDDDYRSYSSSSSSSSSSRSHGSSGGGHFSGGGAGGRF